LVDPPERLALPGQLPILQQFCLMQFRPIKYET